MINKKLIIPILFVMVLSSLDSDIPFDTDDIDEEGLDVILGVDFIQKVGLKIEA